MKLISKIFGDIVWLLIIGFLSLPLIQINYHLYEIPKLNGAIEEVKEPELSLNSWFDGDYQIAIENYINENFGFHDLATANDIANYFYFNSVNVSIVYKGINV